MELVTDLEHGQVEQLRLFEVEAEEYSAPTNDNGSTLRQAQDTAFNDPAFAGNKSLPIHRWVPWIAGFSSDFVRDALVRYLEGKGTVLDPFAGVGTT
ncbi:MAG: hypothetical protein ACE5LU_27760, partial [Anaerolineae bacterium]